MDDKTKAAMAALNLQAVAQKLLCRWDALGPTVHGWGGQPWHQVCDKIERLREALKAVNKDETEEIRRMSEELRGMLRAKDYEGLAAFVNRDNGRHAKEAVERIRQLDHEAVSSSPEPAPQSSIG